MGRSTDVLIVGGGPAGLAVAIAARKKGFHVTVVDGARPPIDKPCGEGLMPGTLAALQELGVPVGFHDGRVFHGIRFVDRKSTAETRFSGGNGLGVRRTVLHQKMLEHAEQAGVTLRWNTPVGRISPDGVLLGGTAISARWIIGADGIHSRIRRWAGLDMGTLKQVRYAQRRHYRVKAWTDLMEIHWGTAMQVYVTPLINDETCVVLMSRDPHLRLEGVWRQFPCLADHLSGAQPSSVERGAVTSMRRLERVYNGRIALVGDASGSVDAITGEGLYLSFRQALALADALEIGDLDLYQQAHRRLAARPNRVSRLLLLLDRFSSVRKRVLRGLAMDSSIFGRLLAAHLGDSSAGRIAAASLQLGWHMLRA